MTNVTILSSKVRRGFIGGTIGEKVLEGLGLASDLIPTVEMEAHPGHGVLAKTLSSTEKFKTALEKSRPGHILSGYFGSKDQVDVAAHWISQTKRQNPDMLYLCDPILGDKGALYIPEEIAKAMRDQLVPLADILTPNLFELEYLAERKLPDIATIKQAAHTLGCPTTLVTSVPIGETELASLLIAPSGTIECVNERLLDVPYGSGDFLAADFFGLLLSGETPENAFERAQEETEAMCRKSAGSLDLAL